MEKIKTEVVEVANNNDAIIFTCLQKEEGKVVEVKWNKGNFDTAQRRIVPTDDKIEKVNDWCKKYFKLDLATIYKAKGKKMDVYVYDTFSSFWKVDARYKKEDAGERFDTEITAVDYNNDAIVVKYQWRNETYHTNYRFTQRVGDAYYINPQKQRKQLEKFENKFGLPIERRDELIGLPISVEVKQAFGSFAYGEITVR